MADNRYMKEIVKQKLKFKDGSRIDYTELPDGSCIRVIYFAATDGEPAQTINYAAKHFYLETLQNVREDKGSEYNEKLFREIEYLYNKTSSVFDLDFCREISGRIERLCLFTHAHVFFCALYLEMIDYELSVSLNKEMVLEGCRAVLIDCLPYKKAANLYKRQLD